MMSKAGTNAIATNPNPLPRGNTKGWAYFSPDVGWEWTRNHPILSGETPDAESPQWISLSEFHRRYPQ